MERVDFITTESGEDLIVAFAISRADPDEIRTLSLMRTPKYEFILNDSDVQRDDVVETKPVLQGLVPLGAGNRCTDRDVHAQVVVVADDNCEIVAVDCQIGLQLSSSIKQCVPSRRPDFPRP